ncbi:RecA/RadA recombinase [Candidatus Nitrososphaera evergladensis SR1]|uniref:RecA/RadA recombinase n=1 Tax=Candidatus Nitrososphaera evergladensis SR1 TaxID=1459636 RepID=A0A075MRR8_9ARCH|nr:AAA family ATPase [Candidatus Nitrososphaera evergladensis]AIF83785.1 RecA/RadA recombinase [Candidatus Nitrososphaera evergladensis SR1]
MFIQTGSQSLDALLGGGIRTGMVTDIYGESGSGKSQLCFSLCASCTKAGFRAFFVDTAGTFRPERVSEMAGTKEALDRITFVRALNTRDQINVVERVRDADARLLVIDTLTSLFSAEYSAGPARHLAVMSHLHDLATFAISTDCAVVVTNMVRNAPTETGKYIQREYLGSSVSIYSHIRMKLALEDPSRGWFHAALLQPSTGTAQFAIIPRGLSDIGD